MGGIDRLGVQAANSGAPASPHLPTAALVAMAPSTKAVELSTIATPARRLDSRLEHHPAGLVTTWETVAVAGNLAPSVSRTIEHAYFSRLGSVVSSDDGLVVRLLGLPLVRLGPVQVSETGGREVLRRPIVGGLLAAKSGELQIVVERPGDDTSRVTIKLESFKPRLPGFLYRAIQGPLHQAVTGRFLRRFAWSQHVAAPAARALPGSGAAPHRTSAAALSAARSVEHQGGAPPQPPAPVVATRGAGFRSPP